MNYRSVVLVILCAVGLAACSKGTQKAPLNPYQPLTVKTSPSSKPSPIPGADLNQQLLAAAGAGEVDRVAELLRGGADINAKDASYDNTPLIRAIVAGRVEVVQLLLKQGADVNAKNRGGYTALDIAEEEYQGDIVKSLIKAGAKRVNPPTQASKADKESDLRQAAVDGDLEKIQRLIRQGADVNARDDNGWTALRCAVFQENLTIVKFLLKQKANPNLRAYDDGTTSLHWAAQVGNTEIVKALLEAGGNPNARDTFSGSTPLNLASSAGYAETARVLKQAGAR